MRPDEHKKKKNLAYKKKHDIPNKSTSKTTDNEKDKKAGGKKDVERQKRASEKSQTQPNNYKRDLAERISSSDDSSSNSDQTEVKISKKKQFRRREIVSNWKKYELEPGTDEKVTVRGEKYETLLNMAGEAMSRFRFQDELEWENDSEQVATVESPSCLQLNPTDLAQSLSCIPIYEILGIDEDLIPEDQLECLKKDALRNKSLHGAQEIKGDITSQSPSQHKRNVDDQISHLNVNNKENTIFNQPKVPSSLATVEIEKSPQPYSDICSSSDREMNDKFVGKQALRDAKPVVQAVQSLSLQDDDLDKLLDIDMGETESDFHSTPTTKDLPFSSKVDCSSEDKKEESEDLEEWLDSILD